MRVHAVALIAGAGLVVGSGTWVEAQTTSGGAAYGGYGSTPQAAVAPEATTAELVYPAEVVDRPVLMPAGVYEGSLSMSSTTNSAIDFGDYVESLLALRAGLKNELSLGLGYILKGTDGSPLSQLTLGVGFHTGQTAAIRMDVFARLPTEDQRQLGISYTFALKRKVMPKLAVGGDVGVAYFVIPDAGPYQLVSVPVSAQADYQVIPVFAASARVGLEIPAWESEGSSDSVLRFAMRGTYAMTARMVDFYLEIGLSNAPGSPKQFLLGAAARFP